MPRLVSSLLAVCLLAIHWKVFAQDKIYTTSGVTKCKITSITSTVVTYLPDQNSKPATLYVKQALLLFNEKGVYLEPAKLDLSLKQNQQLIEKFLHGESAGLQSDYIYQGGDPITVIENTILNEDDKFVYIGKEGKKIEKKSIAAIVYKDGRHAVLAPVARAAGVLWTAYEQKAGSNIALTVSEKKMPVAATDTSRKTTTPNSTANVPPVAAGTESQDTSATVKSRPAQENTPKQLINTPKDTSAPARPATEVAAQTARPSIDNFLDAPNKEEFEHKAKDKASKFSNYLKIICNKKAPTMEVDDAISQAALLFVNEDAIVEVSSLDKPPVRRKIKDYLRNLKLLPYDFITINWTKIQYVTDIKKGMDGNYTGTITFEQEFTGYKDNKVVYSDFTQKKMIVTMKTYEKYEEGKAVMHWDVLLGDVGVEATRSL